MMCFNLLLCCVQPQESGRVHVLTAVVIMHRYGGTVARDNVAAAADWFVYDIHTVLQALNERED